jgi:hypothetical protein
LLIADAPIVTAVCIAVERSELAEGASTRRMWQSGHAALAISMSSEDSPAEASQLAAVG